MAKSFLWVITLGWLTMTLGAGAQTASQPAAAKRIGALFEVQAAAVYFDEAGARREEPLMGLLTLRYPATLDDPLDVTLDVDVPREAWMIEVRRDALPPEVHPALDGAESASFLNNAQPGYRSGAPAGPAALPRLSVKLRPPQTHEDPAKSLSSRLAVADAQGRPAAGFRVELTGQLRHPLTQQSIPYTFVTGTLDAEGAIVVSYPQIYQPRDQQPMVAIADGSGQSRRLYEPENRIAFGMQNIARLTVTSPDGAACTMNYPSYDFSSSSGPRLIDPVQVLMLTEASVAGASAAAKGGLPNLIQGEVVDEAGQPVEGAEVRLGYIRFPNIMTSISAAASSAYPDMVRLGPSGRFALGIPDGFIRAQLSQQEAFIPESVTLTLHVRAPGAPAGDEGVRVEMKPGESKRIVLPSPAARATLRMQILDEAGQAIATYPKNMSPQYAAVILRPMDEQTGQPIIKPNNQNEHYRRIRQWEGGVIELDPVPLPGTYRLEMLAGGDKTIFDPQRLTPEMAAEGPIVWAQPAWHYVYRGRAVDAATGRPIAGAWVALGGPGDHLARMEPHLLEAVYAPAPADGRSIPITNPNYVVGNHHFPVLAAAIARANERGEFEMHHPAGSKPQPVHVWAPGYLMRSASLNIEWPIEEGSHEIRLPDAPLIPTATVGVMADRPAEFPEAFRQRFPDFNEADLRLDVAVGYERPAAWRVGMKKYPNGGMVIQPTVEEPWAIQMDDGNARPGQGVTVTVPAGVALSVSVGPGRTKPWIAPAHWSGIAPLAPGEHRELEPKTLTACRPYVVEVRKADGSPAAGLNVQGDGLEADFAAVTDAKGEVHGWCGGAIGWLRIMRDERGQNIHDVSDVSFDPAAAEWRHVITLPAEAP